MGKLTGLQPRRSITACKIRTLAQELDEQDAVILLQAVDDPNWRVTALADELTRRGIKITKDPIKRHRDKVCSCSKI